MSVFNVFYRQNDDPDDPLTYDQQYDGTKRAGDNFHRYWSAGNGSKTFKDFVIGLIENEGCIVTYKGNDKTDRLTVVGSGANKRLVYKNNPVVLNSEMDNPNTNVVTMAAPSAAVRPTVGETSVYLGNAITKLEDTSINLDERKAFLLGLLLLKRCR